MGEVIDLNPLGTSHTWPLTTGVSVYVISTDHLMRRAAVPAHRSFKASVDTVAVSCIRFYGIGFKPLGCIAVWTGKCQHFGAKRSFESSVSIFHSTQRNILDDSHLYELRYENLVSGTCQLLGMLLGP